MSYYTHTYLNMSVILRVDGSVQQWIPIDSANTDYQEYLEWVALGNTATAYTVPSNDVYLSPSDSEVMFTMEVI